MGLLSKLFTRSTRIETRAAGADYLPANFGFFGGGSYNDTGVQITESNALICSTVWACVSIIAQTISTLPVHVTTRDGGEKQYDHPLHQVLAVSPNEFMTPATFREVLLANTLLWGAGYAVIERDTLGNVVALYPLRSCDVRPIRKGGAMFFEARVGGNVFTFTPDQILYLLGWSLDGISPVSPIRMSAQAVGLSVAMERYAARAFSGGNIGGILQMPKMSDDAMKSFVESWRRNYAGIDNAFKVAALPDPMKFIPTTLDPEKGQLTESRRAQILDVCRIWKVPASMLGELEKASYSSLEAQNMAFFQQTILPWLVKLEQELALKCLLERERPTIEIKFNADALLRASTQERYTAYQTGRQGGWLSINDVRRKEGLPPVEGGDSLLQPLNMTPVNPANAPAPAAPPAPPKPDPAAARSLLEDAGRRVLVKEARALQRAAKKHQGKPDELRKWAADFYAKHEDLVCRTFTAPLKAAGVATDPAEYAKRHVAASLADVTRAIEQRESVEDLTDEWETIRPADVAADLMEK